ncbi:MAG: hypothetical protein AAGN66_11790 [Acidobacteriota bacterium]
MRLLPSSLKTREGRRALLRILIFPWFLWYVCSLLPEYLRERYGWRRSGFGRFASYVLQGLFYLAFGLPATVVVAGEILISLNEVVIAEQADYRLQSDFEAGLEGELEIPGPKSYRPPPVEAAPTEAFWSYLVELYSPVILHKMSHHPEWDIPLLIDFDGNDDPRDNIANEPKFRPHTAGVHGEVTAATEDSFYLTYSLYHVKDYDHPIREQISRWTYHDNDNEGFHIRVDRKTGVVEEIETWFHNRFLLFNHTGVSTGTEPVHGRIYLEDGTHPIIYAQPQGHGVRCAQLVDRGSLGDNIKILRYRGDRPAVPVTADREVQIDATYEIDGFDKWYEVAFGPFGEKGQGTNLFEESIDLGQGRPDDSRYIGRFIAGRDYDINSWSRPKPMWSWDDGWDDIPIFVWHFFPSLSFQSHGGNKLSHVYYYNRPCEKAFGATAAEIMRTTRMEKAQRPGDKWEPLEDRGGHLERNLYWNAFQKKLKAYVNYLFHALG